MKKMGTILFIAAAAILFVLFSCDNQFLDGPQLPPGSSAGAERGISAPEGLKASQGEKRSIMLTWNEEPKAKLYYIYNSENPLNSFVRCGETNSTQFKFTVPPGSTLYYRISSVSYDETESVQSFYVRGTSLAQPVISDITDITESSSAVTWYMENVFEDSYKDKLLYTVYCYNGSVEVAQIALDGKVISENRAVFTGLAPNTRYEYQVEAYLREDQSASEKSDKMDAATARRFRPGAPVDLSASRGAAIDSITLSFELPDMVDIALGENQYDPKPLYFVIFKRFYSESGNNEYQKACSYFGSIAGKGEPFPNGAGYIPGATITWSDTDIRRGIKYEYMVQSYVDDTLKIISSETSKASAVGWTLSEGNLSLGNVEYTRGTGVDLYVSAKLPLDFEFDPQEVSYSYLLKETIEPLKDNDPNDPAENIINKISLNSFDAVLAYIPTMDLTQKTTENHRGRGLYSYEVEIKLNDKVLDTISALDTVEVSENTDPIIVENFRVEDGYKDKFVLKWDNYSNRKYTLYIGESRGAVVKEIGIVNENPTAEATLNNSFSYTYKADDIVPGVTRYFAIKPSRDIGDGSFKNGQIKNAPTASLTLGIPKASLGGDSTYSTVTAAWTEAQKADTYRVKYWYSGETPKTITVKKEALTVTADGKYKFTFKPEGNEIAIANAGKEIEMKVDALNKGLQEAAGSGEISTSSNEFSTRLVGPALLGLSASKAASPQEITVKWNKISGAGGYYVFRRQFNMNNTQEEGSEAVVYYVTAAETPNVPVTGKGLLLDTTNSKIDTPTIAASVQFADGQYTLIDRYMTDGEYDGLIYNRHTSFYREQQNDMIQGCSYRYYVVPVISDSHTALNAIEFVFNKDGSNKNTNIASYTIQENGEVKFLGAASIEQEGFTIGFGQNVTATKGTYKSSGNINNGIKIIWSAPPRLSSVSGFNPRYTVYRRESGGSANAWETLKLDINANEYIETQLIGTRGSAYEYVIGISGSGGTSDPKSSKRFIDKCYTQLDDKGRPKMLGFMLDQVKMESVSRNEQKVDGKFAEEVKWKAAGIKHRDGVGNKWGIDGYEVWVMNRNINTAWHKITEISYDRIPDQIDQSVMVTTGMGSVTINTTAGNMAFDMLRVMRDYRHFFKIRNYVLNEDNERIYSPDPPYVYKYYWKDNERHLFETDYVKWGARQISATEFVTIAMVYMCDGIDQVNGTAWNTAYSTRTRDANGDGTSGKISADSNFWVTSWEFNFQNYKTDLQVRTGEWQHFLTINGKLWAGTGASNQYPKEWGYLKDIDIIGPSDTPGLYTGKMAIGGGTQRGGSVSYRDLPWGEGDISAKYPAGTADQKITLKGENTPMLFTGKGDTRYHLEDYK
jgi:hypothetical protein